MRHSSIVCWCIFWIHHHLGNLHWDLHRRQRIIILLRSQVALVIRILTNLPNASLLLFYYHISRFLQGWKAFLSLLWNILILSAFKCSDCLLMDEKMLSTNSLLLSLKGSFKACKNWNHPICPCWCPKAFSKIWY